MDSFQNKANNKILKIEDKGLSHTILANFVTGLTLCKEFCK